MGIDLSSKTNAISPVFPFSLTDTCYILSFSIIMLNTSLHNPNVKDKPPFERFVSINRGIDNGADLPEELLKVRNALASHFPLVLFSLWLGVHWESKVHRSQCNAGLLTFCPIRGRATQGKREIGTKTNLENMETSLERGCTHACWWGQEKHVWRHSVNSSMGLSKFVFLSVSVWERNRYCNCEPEEDILRERHTQRQSKCVRDGLNMWRAGKYSGSVRQRQPIKDVCEQPRECNTTFVGGSRGQSGGSLCAV